MAKIPYQGGFDVETELKRWFCFQKMTFGPFCNKWETVKTMVQARIRRGDSK